MVKENKEVVKKETGVSTAVHDYGADAGGGFEGTKAKDLTIPFLMLLQANSPQVENHQPEGSKTGMLLNSVTGVLYDANYDRKNVKAGVPFQPCFRQDAYVEWTPRDNGGGIVDRHMPDAKVVVDAIAAAEKKFGKLKLKNGNELVQTHYIYGNTLDEEGKMPNGFAVISCTGTKIKPFKNWFTAMYMLKGRPPLFAHRILLQSFPDSNKKGKFANFVFAPFGKDMLSSLIDPRTESDLLDAGRRLRDMVASGEAKAASEQREHVDGEVDTDADPEGDGKAPF